MVAGNFTRGLESRRGLPTSPASVARAAGYRRLPIEISCSLPEYCDTMTDAMNLILADRTTWAYWYWGKSGDPVRSEHLNVARSRIILDSFFSRYSQHYMLAIAHYPDHSDDEFNLEWRKSSNPCVDFPS